MLGLHTVFDFFFWLRHLGFVLSVAPPHRSIVPTELGWTMKLYVLSHCLQSCVDSETADLLNSISWNLIFCSVWNKNLHLKKKKTLRNVNQRLDGQKRVSCRTCSLRPRVHPWLHLTWQVLKGIKAKRVECRETKISCSSSRATVLSPHWPRQRLAVFWPK